MFDKKKEYVFKDVWNVRIMYDMGKEIKHLFQEIYFFNEEGARNLFTTIQKYISENKAKFIYSSCNCVYVIYPADISFLEIRKEKMEESEIDMRRVV